MNLEARFTWEGRRLVVRRSCLSRAVWDERLIRMDCGRVATTLNDKMLQRFSDLELLGGHAVYSTEAARVGYRPVPYNT